jgi:hypothetical protein
LIALSAIFGGAASRGRTGSLWRSRAALFVLLGVLLLASGAVLVVYHGFYDARLAALAQSREALTKRRDEAKAAADRAAEAERRLVALRADLDRFYGEVLGTRKERLASLIEDLNAITKKAGFQPPTVSFNEDAAPGGDRLTVGFNIEGRYPDIKRLLYAFETSPKFLFLERVQVTLDENAPDVLRVALAVSHYFHGEGPRPSRRPVRSEARAGSVGKTGARKTPAAAEKLVLE